VTLGTYERRRPRRRRRRWPRRVALLALLAIVFVAGVGLGEALHDRPGVGTQTLVRTLEPLTLTPETVTVTTSNP
jgi:hypothetical protein